MSKGIGIIGYPIRHSISPVFQQVALDACGIDARFEAWEVEPSALPNFIDGLRSPDTLGINVTVPHKEAVIPLLDHIDDWATAAGAVNTIVNESGVLSGHNTDGSGFLRALEEHGHFSPQTRRVLILGAGGSAKAVALALARSGVAAITIANRTPRRAQRLAEMIKKHGAVDNRTLAVKAIPLLHQSDRLERAAADSDLVVNCTSMGMRHGPDESGSPLPARLIPSSALVYDLVYNPPMTPLLREARKSGASILGGLPMLVYQGVAAFEFWTGKKAPVEAMLSAAEAALA